MHSGCCWFFCLFSVFSGHETPNWKVWVYFYSPVLWQVHLPVGEILLYLVPGDVQVYSRTLGLIQTINSIFVIQILNPQIKLRSLHVFLSRSSLSGNYPPKYFPVWWHLLRCFINSLSMRLSMSWLDSRFVKHAPPPYLPPLSLSLSDSMWDFKLSSAKPIMPLNKTLPST